MAIEATAMVVAAALRAIFRGAMRIRNIRTVAGQLPKTVLLPPHKSAQNQDSWGKLSCNCPGTLSSKNNQLGQLGQLGQFP
jgi:hypothetical protein